MFIPCGRWAFTLIEMLVVVALISILAALLMPALQGALAQGRQTSCAGNLRQVGIVFNSYGGDWGDYVVNNEEKGGMPRWYINLPKLKYVDNTALFECAANQQMRVDWVGGVRYSTSYGLNTYVAGFYQTTSWPGFGNKTFAQIARTRKGVLRTPLLADSGGAFSATSGAYFLHLTFNAAQDAFSQTPPASIAPVHMGGANTLFADFHVSNIKAPFAPTGQYVYWLQPDGLTHPEYIRF